MNPKIRTTLAAAFAAALLAAFAQPAWAATPSNDEPSGARAMALNVDYTQDTAGATASPADGADGVCGTPEEGSVWYSYTATADGWHQVVTDSLYRAGVQVFAGDPTSATFDGACLGETFNATAGTTYYIVVFAMPAPVSYGTTLDVKIVDDRPNPTMAITVDPRGTAFKDGSAQVSGTYVCTGPVRYADVQGSLVQRTGQTDVNVPFSSAELFVCDGSSHAWSATTAAGEGHFRSGKLSVDAWGYARGRVRALAKDNVNATVLLTRAGH